MLFFIFFVVVVGIFLTSAEDQPSPLASSIWCHGSDSDSRHCSFKNLCLFKNQFLVFLSPKDSVFSGIDSADEQRKLLRFSKDVYMDYVVLPISAFGDFSSEGLEVVEKESVVIKMKSESSLEDVLLNDLIPLYFGLKEHFYGSFDPSAVKIVVILDDEKKKNRFEEELYRVLFDDSIIIRNNNNRRLTCFSKIFSGLKPMGFEEEEDPLRRYSWKPMKNERKYLNEFREYVLRRLSSSSKISTQPDLLFLSENRSSSTTILNNAPRMIGPLCKRFDLKSCKTSFLNFEDHDYKHIIRSLSKTKVLIAISGPLVVGAAFLPSSSVLIEVNPVSPVVKSFASRRGLNYYSWIQPREVETLIESINDQGPYQEEEENEDDWMLPSQVHDVRCEMSGIELNLSWKKPLNLEYLDKNSNSAIYEVMIEGFETGEFIEKFSTKNTEVKIRLSGETYRKNKILKIWILASVKDTKGIDSDFICNLDLVK